MRRKRVISTRTCAIVTTVSTALVLTAVTLAPSASSAAKDVSLRRQAAEPASGAGVQHVSMVTGVRMPRHPVLPERYTVERGDTLSLIARKQEGSYACWPGIYRANSGQVKDPNLIYAGQGLEIPAGCDTRAVRLASSGGAGSADHEPDGDADDPVTHSSSGGGGQVVQQPSGLGGTLSFSGLEQLWEAAGGPSWAAYRAASIAECESGGNQYAYNPSGASGYWQILGEVVPGYIFNPMVNAENAVAKFRASGDTFAQWVCQA